MSAVDTDRMPSPEKIEDWLRDAGFVIIERRRVLRNQTLDFSDQERQLFVEVRGRYSFIPEQEVATGLRLMRAEAKANGGSWIDPPNILDSCRENSADATMIFALTLLLRNC
jgi:hypothetical protein